MSGCRRTAWPRRSRRAGPTAVAGGAGLTRLGRSAGRSRRRAAARKRRGARHTDRLLSGAAPARPGIANPEPRNPAGFGSRRGCSCILTRAFECSCPPSGGQGLDDCSGLWVDLGRRACPGASRSRVLTQFVSARPAKAKMLEARRRANGGAPGANPLLERGDDRNRTGVKRLCTPIARRAPASCGFRLSPSLCGLAELALLFHTNQLLLEALAYDLAPGSL
jgi:hypothetical protein